VLGADPLHRAAEEVGEKQAVHQHGLRPGDRLLVARDEAGTRGGEELLRGVGRDEVAGAEDIPDARTRAAVLDEALEVDHLFAEADELAPLAVRGDVADLEDAAPAHLLEEQAEIVIAVEAAVDEVDGDALPRHRLADRLEVRED
jgi:hypothetical protein